jgi:hypothetical protein
MINEVTPGYHKRLHAILFDAAHLALYPSIKEADLSNEERQEVSDLALHKSRCNNTGHYCSSSSLTLAALVKLWLN